MTQNQKNQQNRIWQKNLPMAATFFRISITPFIVVAFLSDITGSDWICALLFILGSITDWLDGYWARKYAAESSMGKFLDPVADKILVLGSLIVLLHAHRVDPIMVLLLLSRDIFIGGLRSVAAADGVIIAAKPFGKWKTALQMLALPLLFIKLFAFGISFQVVGYGLLWISVILSTFSGLQYTLGYYRGRSAL